MRSYGLDPSLLLDLCRQSVVYETPSALCDGLAAILSDRVALPAAPGREGSTIVGVLLPY